MDVKVSRNNGFSRKKHPLQILSYFAFLSNNLIFYTIIIHILPIAMQIISGVIFTLFTCGTLISGFLCSYIDPTDEIVFLERRFRRMNLPFDTNPYEYFCHFCDTHVSNNSKHCKQCERCVKDFDHHCKWVNNCVGKKNYREFIVLITSVLGSSVIFLVSSFYLTYEYCTGDRKALLQRPTYNIDEKGLSALIYLIWIFSSIVSLFMILDANLLVFHCWLIKRGMTTYDYILRRREGKGIKVTKKRKKIASISAVGGKTIDEIYEEEVGKSVNMPLSPKTTDDSKPYSHNITPDGTLKKIEEVPKVRSKSDQIKNCMDRLFNKKKNRVKVAQDDLDTPNNGKKPIIGEENIEMNKLTNYFIENGGCNIEAEIMGIQPANVNNHSKSSIKHSHDDKDQLSEETRYLSKDGKDEKSVKRTTPRTSAVESTVPRSNDNRFEGSKKRVSSVQDNESVNES